MRASVSPSFTDSLFVPNLEEGEDRDDSPMRTKHNSRCFSAPILHPCLVADWLHRLHMLCRSMESFLVGRQCNLPVLERSWHLVDYRNVNHMRDGTNQQS